MKKMFIRWCFCGTPAEYEAGKRLHNEELKVYRKRWYYILGLLLILLPSVYLLKKYDRWDVWLSVLLVTIGIVLTRDTAIEHYVVKLIREREEGRKNEENT